MEIILLPETTIGDYAITRNRYYPKPLLLLYNSTIILNHSYKTSILFFNTGFTVFIKGSLEQYGKILDSLWDEPGKSSAQGG